MEILILIIGFVVLIKGADVFVDGASSVAGNLKVSKMLVGLTIVAFGTSAPEFAVSVKSIFMGSGELVLGNVIGSNIINVLLILGLTSCISPLVVKNDTVKKEIPILLLGTLLLPILFLDDIFDKSDSSILSRSDGLAILLFFFVFLYYLISVALKNKRELREKEKPQYGMIKSLFLTIFGIVAIVLGSNAVVDNTVIIAENFGVSNRLISLTIIALGTSLPELVTSVTAALKKEQDIAIGNIIGSNVFNIGIVLGLPISMFGGISPIGFTYLDIIMLVISALLLFIFCYTGREISRKEGIVMLIVFIMYYGYIIFK